MSWPPLVFQSLDEYYYHCLSTTKCLDLIQERSTIRIYLIKSFKFSIKIIYDCKKGPRNFSGFDCWRLMLKHDTFFFATSDRVQLLLVSDKQKQDDHAVAVNDWLTILRLSFSSSLRKLDGYFVPSSTNGLRPVSWWIAKKSISSNCSSSRRSDDLTASCVDDVTDESFDFRYFRNGVRT